MLEAIKLSARQSVYISQHSIKSSFINFISQLGLNVAAAFPTHLPVLLTLSSIFYTSKMKATVINIIPVFRIYISANFKSNHYVQVLYNRKKLDLNFWKISNSNYLQNKRTLCENIEHFRYPPFYEISDVKWKNFHSWLKKQQPYWLAFSCPWTEEWKIEKIYGAKKFDSLI